jgi:hypothetical protein
MCSFCGSIRVNVYSLTCSALTSIGMPFDSALNPCSKFDILLLPSEESFLLHPIFYATTSTEFIYLKRHTLSIK